jgi:maltooligosyltrehalose synthase
MAKAAFSQSSFDLLASGYTPEQIAEARKVSIRTVRREIDTAIARRRLDAPERYIHVQVARLTKALRFADAALERGDLKAVRALVEVVAAMDRYHGLIDTSKDRARASSPSALELHSTAASAPPLRLFHADSPPEGAQAESEEVTALGA